MSKHLLYAGFELMLGHTNFDRIHLQALRQSGYRVDVALPEQMMRQHKFSPEEVAAVIPEVWTRKGKRAWANRCRFVMALRYLRKHVPLDQYDGILVATCDELALWLMPLSNEMYIYCHSNGQYVHARGWAARIKRWCLRKLARHHHFIVFNEEMRQPLLELQPRSVEVVQHGCAGRYPLLPEVSLPLTVSPYSSVIFHASPVPDRARMQQLVEDKAVQTYLVRHHILLILRNIEVEHLHCPHIQSLNHYLKTDQYQQLFLRADLILLAYPPSFRCRVSGVSFECVAQGKRMVYARIPALSYCQQFYNYDPSFGSNEEFLQRLDLLRRHPQAQLRVSPADLFPNYKHLL